MTEQQTTPETAPAAAEQVRHTPGPWMLCAHLENMEADKSCGCGYRGGIWGSDEEHMVCEMGSTLITGSEGLEAPRYAREVELANAHLIAAAPDLLSALKELLDVATNLNEREPDHIAARNRARLVIAAAEGREGV